MKIISVVGARPNFMKLAPVAKAIRQKKGLKHIIVHTGQHYDHTMSDTFFKELGIPQPGINLGVGSGSHGEQTGQIMILFEKILVQEKPDVVLVFGDVNSTMACSLVATKLRVPVAHVEAGLRSFDRDMPEEINRLVTDSVVDILFTTSEEAQKNLTREGIPRRRIFFVGNVMIDTLLENVKKARNSKILSRLQLSKKNYVLVTLHRPSNVDSKKVLTQIIGALERIQKDIQVVFPIHPRTKKNLLKFVSSKDLKAMKNLILLDPLGYIDFLQLTMNAKFVITDSGGVQEETTVLGIPCLTVRKNTERPVTVTVGTNILVGMNQQKIIRESMKILAGKEKRGRQPRYWDGKASRRIIQKIIQLHQQKRLLR